MNNTPIIEPLGPCDGPSELYARFSDLPHACLLQSGLVDHQIGRYSIVTSQPFGKFTTNAICRNELELGSRTVRTLENPFQMLDKVLGDLHVPSGAECPVPFVGGVIGYFGYELLHNIEQVEGNGENRLRVPDSCFLFYDHGVVYDHVSGEAYLVALPRSRVLQERQQYRDLLERVRRRSSGSALRRIDIASVKCAPHRPLVSADGYREMVRTVKRYICAGDIYQACTTYGIEMEYGGSPASLYHVLSAVDPAPFSALVDFGNFQIVSSSPERFLRVDNDRMVQARPIKGTRPRGKTVEDDAAMRAALASSEKDRAENLMIVDLLRNDLGRVCETGTVRVPELFKIEAYATVFQLVSTIEGKLRQSESALSCIQACFPGGSMTGAPKIRAIKILKDIEHTTRGIYAGALGYLSFNGSADLSIVIRTIVLKDGVAFFNVGGGIVHDSDPESEYLESLDKARALISAISYCDFGVENNAMQR